MNIHTSRQWNASIYHVNIVYQRHSSTYFHFPFGKTKHIHKYIDQECSMSFCSFFLFPATFICVLVVAVVKVAAIKYVVYLLIGSVSHPYYSRTWDSKWCCSHQKPFFQVFRFVGLIMIIFPWQSVQIIIMRSLHLTMFLGNYKM